MIVYYNKKMYNFGDAKNWTNLSDIASLWVYPNSSSNVEITENWFATSITVSFEYRSKRLVTYANNLDQNSKTLSQYQNLV